MGNFYMESTQINYRRDEKTKTVDQKLRELSETSAIDTDIAPVFKSTNTYQPGDMVYYRNKLYVFNVEHTGTWAAADVTATDVTTEISSLNSGLTNKVGIASATDLNNEKSIGVRTFAYNTPNNPSNHSGSMLGLFQSESYGLQLAQCSSETEAYVRFYNTDTWSSWDKIATDSDLTNKTKDTSFNVTCGECFSVERQGSHYITDKVVHINCLVKALSVPDETDVNIAILPSGMTAIKQEGMTFPIFKADGRWGRFDSIMYGYVSTYALTTKKSEVVADHYYYVDFIAHIT